MRLYWNIVKIAVAAATLAVAPGGMANAMPDTWSITIYYSDATYSQAVGRVFEACNGSTQTWGVVTEWMDSTTGDC